LLGENYDKLQDKNIDIYIIRHGEGTHNIKKGLKKKLTQVFGNNDTELTKNGINQAINAGNALKKYLINNKITKFDYLFGSKLKRTRQTLINILGQIDIENFNIPKHIIILPCSHELSKFKESINCDELNESTFIPSENRANCVCGATDTMSINCNTTKIQTNPECINEKGYNIDWTKFNEFTQKRALYSKKDLEYSGCRNTNFIKQIIDIISK
jgi:bisphosphoglycerate-dependent phosphoglycerate mutase